MISTASFDPGRALHYPETVFRSSRSRGRDFAPHSGKQNQRTLIARSASRFPTPQIPLTAMVLNAAMTRLTTWILRANGSYFINEGLARSSWIVELASVGKRHGKPSLQRHLFLTSLRTTPKACCKTGRTAGALKKRHWIRDTQLR